MLKALNFRSLHEKHNDKRAKQKVRSTEKLSPYLPNELVGGSVPFVAGTEEEAVWKAASQACATEKVHFVYSVEDKHCWYIACPSVVLASNPDSWCPLAAALPKNSEFWDKETVYLYEQDGMASALKWDVDAGRLQVSLGASRTLLPRMQSMDANFVTVNGQTAKPVPWMNLALMSEKISRDAAWLLVVSGLVTSALILTFLAFQLIKTADLDRDLMAAKIKADKAVQAVIIKAHETAHSEPIMHMVRVQEILDDLDVIGGTLQKYEVDGDKLVWEVLVPEKYKKGTKSIKGQLQTGDEREGFIRIKGVH